MNSKMLALVETLDDTLAVVETKTVGDTLRDVKAKAAVKALANTLVEVGTKTLGDTLYDRRLRHWSTRWLIGKQRWKPKYLSEHYTICNSTPW